ncbi:hypothetical protein RR46_00123 [Papilio xuthus]|uniref:Uncharacterized protein n=1 Tax=Papilio xuthus TaxID=66420 RepID=A0A0N1IDG2_PAPXU|nr:hypothetical protein RR46_00123 [Papilio xuthus]
MPALSYKHFHGYIKHNIAYPKVVFIHEPGENAIDVGTQRVSDARVDGVLGDITRRKPSTLQRIKHLTHIPAGQLKQRLNTVF